MTWAEFKAKVLDNLLEDAKRRNTESWAQNLIKAAVIDLQRLIPTYQIGHKTIYSVEDVQMVGQASVGGLPQGAKIRDAYFLNTGYMCQNQPIWLYDWGNRNDLICGNLPACTYAMAIDPQATRFIVHPRVADGREIELNWDGEKTDFDDEDEVPFTEQTAYCVSLFVTGHFYLRVKNDAATADIYISKTPGKVGMYYSERAALYISEKQRRMMKEIAPSPMGAEACTCPPAEAVADAGAGDGFEEEAEIHFVAFGDFGKNTVDEREVSELVKGFHPDFMVWLGDCNYEVGHPESMQNNILKYYDGYVPKQVYAVWGNHDLETMEDGQWGKPLLNLLPGIAALNGGKLYYSVRRGPVEFFMLNSGFTDTEPREPDGISSTGIQGAWCQNKLAASTAPWRIVCLHRGPYSSEDLHGPGSLVMRWPFKAWGADLVLSGHSHNYERLYYDGMTYLVAGLGGHSRRDFANPRSGSQLRYNKQYGALRLSASATRLQAAFYSVDKNIVDSIGFTK